MSIRDFLVALIAFLSISAMITVALPEGNMRGYTKYVIGLLTILFLLTFGKEVNFDFAFGENLVQGSYDVGLAEGNANERINKLMEERIADDLLSTYPQCQRVIRVSFNKNGGVEGIEIIANGVISRSELSERYGVATEHIIIRGVGEYEDDTIPSKTE